MLLNHLKVSHKLSGLAVLVIIGVSLIVFVSLFSLRESLLENRKTQTQFLIESAYSILDNYHQRFMKGELTEQEAKKQSLANIASLRYGDNGYFWINNTQEKMIMHPIKPELDGKDMSQTKDKKGKKLFLEFTDIVAKKGSGFVHYYWPKPGGHLMVLRNSLL